MSPFAKEKKTTLQRSLNILFYVYDSGYQNHNSVHQGLFTKQLEGHERPCYQLEVITEMLY
jgi:hypothetical protein